MAVLPRLGRQTGGTASPDPYRRPASLTVDHERRWVLESFHCGNKKCNKMRQPDARSMPAEEFRALAKLAYGSDWGSKMPVEFGVHRATVWRWRKLGCNGPAAVLLRVLARVRQGELPAGGDGVALALGMLLLG